MGFLPAAESFRRDGYLKVPRMVLELARLWQVSQSLLRRGGPINGLSQLSSLHLLIPGGCLHPVVPKSVLGDLSKGKDHRELDPPLLASLDGFTFMGFYGMGLVYKAGCLSSTFGIKKMFFKPEL